MTLKNTWLLLISITLLKYVTSVDIECDFKNDDFDVITNQYTCDVQNNLMINSKNVVIQAFRGSHKFGKTSNDVTGLSINDKRIQFMPENLGEKFQNLIALKIRQGRLKEINKDNLKSFPKLRYLNFDANDIESLDDDLFEFNPQLEIIWFDGNRIKNTGMTVFDHLKNLMDLDLNGNVCISKRMSNGRGMAEFLREVRKNCFDAGIELVKFKQKYKEVNARNLNNLPGSDVEIIGNVSISSPNAQMLISNKDAEIEELRIVVRNLTELMETKEKEAEEKLLEIQSKIKEKDEKLKEFDIKISNLTSEKNESTLQLSKCQNKLREENSNFTAEITEKNTKIDQLSSQLIDLQVLYSQSLEKYENLSIENQKLIETSNNNELRLKDIDMESLPDDLEEKIKEFIKLDSQLEKRETDLKKFEMEVASTISTLKKSKENIEKVLKHKKLEIVKKDNEIKKLKAANAQYQNKNHQLQNKLKDMKSRSISLERIVKSDIVSLQELIKTKELLEMEKSKFQDLEVKFNASLENKTIECLIHQELEASNQHQLGMENSNETEQNLAQKCPEQLKNIQAKIILKNNRIRAMLMENKQLKDEKVTLLTRQGKLKEILNNKTLECSQEAINELLIEKSQLKNEINILIDSEDRLKNSLSNKYGNCYNNIEKLNQDLKNSSQIEIKLKDKIAEITNIIVTNNSTIASLMHEMHQLKNQQNLLQNSDLKLNTTNKNLVKDNQELKNCTQVAEDLRRKNMQLEDIINNQNLDDSNYDDDLVAFSSSFP